MTHDVSSLPIPPVKKRRLSPTPPTTPTIASLRIDSDTFPHSSYPHIMSSILSYSHHTTLLSFRTMSHAYRREADKLLFSHIVVYSSGPDQYSPLSLRSPWGNLPGVKWENDQTLHDVRNDWLEKLRHARILDYCTGASIPELDPQLAQAFSQVTVVRRHVQTVKATLFAPTLVDWVYHTEQGEDDPYQGRLGTRPRGVQKYVLNIVYDGSLRTWADGPFTTTTSEMHAIPDTVVIVLHPLPGVSERAWRSFLKWLIWRDIYARLIATAHVFWPGTQLTIVGAFETPGRDWGPKEQRMVVATACQHVDPHHVGDGLQMLEFLSAASYRDRVGAEAFAIETGGMNARIVSELRLQASIDVDDE